MLSIREADLDHIAATIDVLESCLEADSVGDEMSEEMLKDARDIISEVRGEKEDAEEASAKSDAEAAMAEAGIQEEDVRSATVH